ncbi:MAG: hypothetical protein ACFB2Y_09315 [Fulvivirga sp.]
MNRRELIISLIAIVTSGAYLGNLINMGLVHAPYWQSLEPMDFMLDFSNKFDLLVTTLPPTRLPSFVAIIVVIWLYRKNTRVMRLWIYALIPVLIGLALSVFYFLPINNGFLEQSFTPAEAVLKLQWWINVHWVRIVLSAISTVYTVIAFKNSVESNQYKQMKYN